MQKFMEKQSSSTEEEDSSSDSRVRTAAYIADLVRELERLAKKEKIEPLSKFLHIAYEEARRVAYYN